ncbi:MAG: hypothetical protein COX82_03300 [Candidatus Magasanikbacteria bacterium CG_4_10_14_0_2_um_filter_41_10]|uniref:Serine aminopeptidase S33 domain-containing protein n=1 Tax=Candidatus Magasanikbacteria bacterium CG_4_10_14_0_2_um_filter_41_10 TaxID=1974638 RepID=A0A2M7V3Q0_9BACT|nr:MAG: hypothetical protein COX82_03300 [Candidatus Magasanikbacteria bacterium CG_4_10_14_0_2_um_filter_41_10]
MTIITKPIMDIKSVSIPVKSEKLSGLLFTPKSLGVQKLPSILIFHGRGSNKKRYVDRAQALAKKGFITLIFDFRGCGESGGDFRKQTIAMGFEDAEAGFEFLKNQSLCDRNKIGVLGGSFGGYQAALLSSKYSIASLILASPAVYQDEWWGATPESIDSKRIEIYKHQSGFDKTKAIKAIRKYPGQILIIEHERDDVIPKEIIEAYWQNTLRAKLKEKKVIIGAPHALYEKKFLDRSTQIVIAWFMRTL